MSIRRIPVFFLAPFTTTFVLFFLVPIGYAGYLSLFVRRRSGIGPAHDVFGGLSNYVRAFQDADFLGSFANIARFGVVQIPLMIGLALVLALALDTMKGPLARFLHAAYYLPYTIPGVIAGLLWGYMYSKSLSPFNDLLGALGLGSVDFVDSRALLYSIGNIVTWSWTGYNMVVLYAALQSVPREVYDAARVDGAEGWSLVRFVKIPLLRPALLLTLIFTVIGTSQIFAEPFVLQSVGYVPDNITPNTYIYQVAARDGNYSYGAALAIVLALITFALSSVVLRQVLSEREP